MRQAWPSGVSVPEHSGELAAQYQRGGAAVRPRIIAFASAYFAKARPVIELSRRRVVVVDLKENDIDAEPGEAAKMQIEQTAGMAAAALRRRDRDRQNLGLVRSNA